MRARSLSAEIRQANRGRTALRNRTPPGCLLVLGALADSDNTAAQFGLQGTLTAGLVVQRLVGGRSGGGVARVRNPAAERLRAKQLQFGQLEAIWEHSTTSALYDGVEEQPVLVD